MIFLLLLVIGFNCASTQIITCSDDFCTEYLSKNVCPKLPENCQIQNSTHNGLVLPYTGPCNCCDYCLENLAEGSTCSVGTPTSTVPSNICGDGLECNSTNKKCERIVSACTEAQDKYDEAREDGTLGNLQIRPNCDRNGKFVPYVCVTGEICYCVDDEGKRIFGEMPFSSIADNIMKCKCAKAHNSASKILGKNLLRNEHFRCNEDGSYDTIQCIDDKCFCVDREDGKPTNPDLNLVDHNLLTNKTLPCFNNDLHMEYDYFRDCESNLIKKYIEVVDVKKEGYDVYGIVYPKCGLDGYYHLVQYNETHKYCVDKYGDLLDNYIVTLESGDNMNCKCARARQLISGNEKPDCDKMGNYLPKQCRRGECRCVDENGNQIKKEVDQNEPLDCSKI